jgi:parvulin-like peptidyl-prolyl isomerase
MAQSVPPAPAQAAPAAGPTSAPQAASATDPSAGLDYCSRVVAYIHENQPISRQELGEYLIARYGVKKLPLLLNKKIVETACRSRGISITAAEVDIALAEELKNMRLDLSTFVKTVLPRYKKTLFEWKDDVLRPRLLMTRFCQKQVVVSEEEIQHAYEAAYGEKIRGRLIQWKREDEPKARSEYGRLRDSEEAFNDAAHHQSTSELASTGGKLQPFGRYTLGDDKLDDLIFKLAPGQVSDMVTTEKAVMLFKCDARIPPDNTINQQSVREKLIKDIADRKIGAEINATFEALSKQANPQPLKFEIHQPGTALPPADQVIGYINGSVGVTREDLGEYLIARYGAERLELLVNHRIIDQACQARGVQVSAEEIEKGFQEDLKAIHMDEATFEKDMLSKWGKTTYEWREDVVRPKLQLAKLAQARVTITEDEIKKGYEAYHGEKVAVRMILYPPGQEKFALTQYQIIQNSEEEFDRAAREQPSPSLAAKHGKLDQPIGRNALDDKQLEEAIFNLNPGQVSALTQTPQGQVVVKCDRRIPPDGKPLDAQTRAEIDSVVRENKLTKETQAVFQELRNQANPKLLLRDVAQAQDLVAETKRIMKDLPDLTSFPPEPGTQAGRGTMNGQGK